MFLFYGWSKVNFWRAGSSHAFPTKRTQLLCRLQQPPSNPCPQEGFHSCTFSRTTMLKALLRIPGRCHYCTPPQLIIFKGHLDSYALLHLHDSYCHPEFLCIFLLQVNYCKYQQHLHNATCWMTLLHSTNAVKTWTRPQVNPQWKLLNTLSEFCTIKSTSAKPQEEDCTSAWLETARRGS